jgi:peptidyl-prolyl cis-trans isomerase SurA
VKSRGGYYLLYLNDRMEPYGTPVAVLPTAAEAKLTQLPLARILLPLGEKPSKELTEGAMKVADTWRQTLPNCGEQVKKFVEEQHAIFFDMGTVTLADLVPEAQQALAQTRSGEIAAPFVSPAGIELFARCDARQEVVTAFQMPTRDEVQMQLFENRITAMARGYERDLRRKANVEEH